MTLRTKRNLDIAMHGEAFAAAKYKRFAAFARTRGIADHAELLNGLADESRIGHFADEFRLAGLLSDDAQNLQDALRDKLYHVERYRQFAHEAEQDGDKRAATLFEMLMEDDQAWIRKLDKALAETGKGTEHS
jgi:rubrerythrin